MKKIWNRLVIVMSIGWMTSILILIWFSAQEPNTDIALMLGRLIK